MKKHICLILVLASLVSAVGAQSTADSLLNFIKNNKARAALYLVENDVVIAQLNENKMMPLASTVKILVALEFAKQAGQQIFDKDKLIAIKDLEKYYLPNTDGGAHPGWLAFERSQNHILLDSVALINVARGMIMFSSNANTDYLMELLGLDNIRNNLQLLGVTKHSAVYPMVASLYMYQNPRMKTEESILKSISKLSDEQYGRYIFAMHKALTHDTILKKKFRPQDFTMKMQKMWSDRLPASTVKDYAQIVNVLNNRKYFDNGTYAILSQLLETAMENPANKQWIVHAGMKGGSTASVLTKASYATLKNKDRVELAYFFNDLSPEENKKLQGWMNSFELKILSDKTFRETVAKVL